MEFICAVLTHIVQPLAMSKDERITLDDELSRRAIERKSTMTERGRDSFSL